MADERINFTDEFPTEEQTTTETTETTEAAETTEETTMSTEAPADTAATTAASDTYVLKDGSTGSRAAFIRELFLQDNLSRKEIAEKYELPYRVVYSATVNMSNSAESTPRGRTATSSTVQVTSENKLVVTQDGNTYVNGELIKAEDVEALGELKEVSRNDWIQQAVDSGISRGDIAKWLSLSYGVIYNLTKEQEGTRARVMVPLEDGTEVSRAEYIRMQFLAGVSRSDIAKALDVPYTVVWQATKTEKTEQDRFAETIETLKTFSEKVSDGDLFTQILSALATITIKEGSTDAAASGEATEESQDNSAETAE